MTNEDADKNHHAAPEKKKKNDGFLHSVTKFCTDHWKWGLAGAGAVALGAIGYGASKSKEPSISFPERKPTGFERVWKPLLATAAIGTAAYGTKKLMDRNVSKSSESSEGSPSKGKSSRSRRGKKSRRAETTSGSNAGIIFLFVIILATAGAMCYYYLA